MIAFLASIPAQLHAGQIGISMSVPLFCRAAIIPSGGPQDGTVRNVGILREACNSATGYTVIVQHPEGLENAHFLISGDNGVERIDLSPSGYTILTSSSIPNRQTRQLSIELASPDQQIPWISLSTNAS